MELGPLSNAAGLASVNPLQFDANATPSSVIVGSTAQSYAQPSSVYLNSLGNLNLGNITSFTSSGPLDVTSQGNLTVLAGATLANNGPLDIMAQGNLTVLAGATLYTGTGTLSLAADTSADGVGTLSVQANSVLDAGTIALRSADMNLNTWANVGSPVFSGAVVTTLAGSEADPTGVAVDSTGNVYVADYYNYEIRKITPSGVVTTMAGSAGQSGSVDGTGSAARFYLPSGVAVDSAGNVYVADYHNDEIRKISPSGVVTTLAGSVGPLTIDYRPFIYRIPRLGGGGETK